jgi:hypothetical protein
LSGNLKGRDNMKDLSIDGRIRMNLREVCWEVVDWTHLVQGKEQWQALVNMVMNVWVL